MPPPKTRNSEWEDATHARPCEVCGKQKLCSRTADDAVHICRRAHDRGLTHPRYGPGRYGTDGLGPRMVFFSPETHRRGWVRREPAADHQPDDGATPTTLRGDERPDRSAYLRELHEQLTPDLARALMAQEFRLPAFAADYPFRRGVGYAIDTDAHPYFGCDDRIGSNREGWVLPETDGAGRRLVGGSVRLWRPCAGIPKKRFLPGTHRGVTFDPFVIGTTGPVVVVEGASDEFALSIAGVPTIGRPSNTGGVADLVAFLNRNAGRQLLIVAERDRDPETGEWPGLTGARHVAAKLVDSLPSAVVGIALMPDGEKDPRGWINARVTPATTEAEYVRLVRELVAKIEAAAVRVAPPCQPANLRYPRGPERCNARGTGATLQKVRDPRVNLIVRSACRRHSCPGCHRRLIRTAVFELGTHIIRDAEHRLQPSPAANPDPKPSKPGSGPISRLWAAVDPAGKWDTVRNRLGRGRLDAIGWVRIESECPDGDGFARILDTVNAAATSEPRATDTQADASARGVNLLTEGIRYKINSTRTPADETDSPEDVEPEGDIHSGAYENTVIQINSTRTPAVTTAGRASVLLLAALPPQVEPGPGFVEVGVADGLDLMNHACLRVPTSPRTGKRCRPIVSSYSWPIAEEEEEVPEFKRLGGVVGPTAIAADIAAELGFDVSSFDSAKLIEPGAKCIGEEARAFVLARLAETDHPRRADLAHSWAAALPHAQPVGNLFCQFVTLHLLTGPPDGAYFELIDIGKRDALRIAEDRERDRRDAARYAEVIQEIQQLTSQTRRENLGRRELLHLWKKMGETVYAKHFGPEPPAAVPHFPKFLADLAPPLTRERRAALDEEAGQLAIGAPACCDAVPDAEPPATD